MAGLSHLKDILEKRGSDFINNLLNNQVIINEKMDGAFFGIKKDTTTNKIRFFKRNSEFTYVDRVLSKFFEKAVSYFEKNNDRFLKEIPPNYFFGMEYFSNKKPQSISYDKIPKNNLILSYINILDETGNIVRTIQTKEELNKWADILGIEQPPIIFQGKLSDEQKKKINEFIHTPFNELLETFKTISFTRYIISILNPNLEKTFLNESLDKDIEGVVFRFYSNDTKEDPIFVAKLIDPAFQEFAKKRIINQNANKSDDYVWIIVIDLMNFIEQYSLSELRNIKLNGNSYEERYISLINELYLKFIKEFGQKYRDLDIQVPDFLQKEEFSVNLKLLKNKNVESMIESNSNFKEIYRIFLNMFRKKKIRVNSSFFTKEMKVNLNDQISKISKIIMGDSVYESYFPTFNEFVGEDRDPGYFETFKELENRKTKPVNLIISDFQPIHIGHIKSAESLFDENGLPCLLVLVHNGRITKMKPFKKETIVNGLQKLQSTHPSFITGYVAVPNGEVESLLKTMKPDYEPNIIAATNSRIRDIALQLELAKKRSRNLNFKNNVRLMEMPQAAIKDIIMDTIRNNDYSTFKSAAPSEIHSDFINMTNDVMEQMNSNIQINEGKEHNKKTDSNIKKDDIQLAKFNLEKLK